MSMLTAVLLVPLQICPLAPPGAQVQADKLGGYALWGVLFMFIIAPSISVASMVAGRIFHSPHLTRGGVIGLLVVLIAAVLYVIAPTIVGSITGAGCIG